MTHQNEFNQEFSEKEIENYTDRISRLLDEEIDIFSKRIEFTVDEREQDMEALMKYHLAEIRDGAESVTVYNLLMETNLEIFEKELTKIETEHNDLMEDGREKLGLS